jgi:hypothetical protein
MEDDIKIDLNRIDWCDWIYPAEDGGQRRAVVNVTKIQIL